MICIIHALCHICRVIPNAPDCIELKMADQPMSLRTWSSFTRGEKKISLAIVELYHFFTFSTFPETKLCHWAVQPAPPSYEKLQEKCHHYCIPHFLPVPEWHVMGGSLFPSHLSCVRPRVIPHFHAVSPKAILVWIEDYIYEYLPFALSVRGSRFLIRQLYNYESGCILMSQCLHKQLALEKLHEVTWQDLSLPN